MPDNVIFLYKKANIYENLGNTEDAIDVYERIVEENRPILTKITEKSRKKSLNWKK